MFTPLRTERLLIRPFVAEDAAGLTARRNDPAVAEYQNWTLPYSLEKANTLVSGLIDVDGPQDEQWWMAVVCDPATGVVYGDLALHLTQRGRSAEVGYTFASEYWGRGYATEALAALVGYLFDTLGVTRVSGTLHPENIASAMVLERTGFLFEGHTRLSYWVGDECSDDWLYGLTRPDWESWRDRPRHPPGDVRLVEATAENEPAVSRLVTHKSQEAFVAPMTRSFVDVLFPEMVNGAPLKPWLRAVTADDEVVGFVMLGR